MNQQNPYVSKKQDPSKSMATLSIVLGIVAISSSFCIYLALPCGALAIMFALLSRGGSMAYPSTTKIGLILGGCGFVLTIVLFVVMFIVTLNYYGGIEGMFQQVMTMYGASSIEELYQILGY